MNTANAIRIPQALPRSEATDLHPDYHPCARTNRRAALLITILGSSLAFMDGSIVNVALRTLQGVFHAGASSVQWVVQNACSTTGVNWRGIAQPPFHHTLALNNQPQ